MHARIAILLTALATLALVYARLLNQHATILHFGITYGMCDIFSNVSGVGETCATWRMEAGIEALAVVLLAGATLVYVARRPEVGR